LILYIERERGYQAAVDMDEKDARGLSIHAHTHPFIHPG
jgi:hypothetical protein